jgi:hypothetical protein
MDKAVCQAQGFLGTLSATELTTANPAMTDTTARTKWSNLPTGMVARGGIKMGSLSTNSQAAALELMKTVLSADGYSDLDGIRAADSYLGTMQGGYGADLYYVAIFGTPSATGQWEVMFGGHHMAFNIVYSGGEAHPTPNHQGAEPKAPFTLNGTTYAPVQGEGAAMQAIFTSLDSTQLASAYLSGQTFGDVLIGPVEYGTGSSTAAKNKFPTGTNRKGVLVSSLSADQQALVTASIAQWVGDYDTDTATRLMTAYTGAYSDTYVAWAGTQSAGVDVDKNGTYMRIDGPRAWIEIACQGGIVIQGVTHYHMIYRDKSDDYAGTL